MRRHERHDQNATAKTNPDIERNSGTSRESGFLFHVTYRMLSGICEHYQRSTINFVYIKVVRNRVSATYQSMKKSHSISKNN